MGDRLEVRKPRRRLGQWFRKERLRPELHLWIWGERKVLDKYWGGGGQEGWDWRLIGCGENRKEGVKSALQVQSTVRGRRGVRGGGQRNLSKEK